MTGRIHSVQSLGTVDGPGVRSVLFLQGCPLRCPYCHNPDTWDVNGGTEMTAREAADKLLKYRAYFGETGGVTVSGGEPLLQAEFVYELFSLLKAEGIHTALDTSGVILNDSVKKLLSVTDYVLLDIKYSTPEKFRRYIGTDLQKALDFLFVLNQNKIDTCIRQVITTGVNDTEEDVLQLREICEGYTCVKKIELLPFRKLCAEKYSSMGIEFPFGHLDATDKKTMEILNSYL